MRLILAPAVALALAVVGLVAVEAWGVYEFEPHMPGLAGQDSCLVYDLGEPCIPIPAGMAILVAVIIECESRWDARAISPTGDYGLFQLNRRWQEGRANQMGYAWDQMLVAGPNTAVAVAIWQERGWAAWSCRP